MVIPRFVLGQIVPTGLSFYVQPDGRVQALVLHLPVWCWRMDRWSLFQDRSIHGWWTYRVRAILWGKPAGVARFLSYWSEP